MTPNKNWADRNLNEKRRSMVTVFSKMEDRGSLPHPPPLPPANRNTPLTITQRQKYLDGSSWVQMRSSSTRQRTKSKKTAMKKVKKNRLTLPTSALPDPALLSSENPVAHNFSQGARRAWHEHLTSPAFRAAPKARRCLPSPRALREWAQPLSLATKGERKGEGA